MAVGVLEAGLGKGTGEELLSFRSQNFIASSTANPVPHPFPAVLVSPSPGLPGAFLQGVESSWQGSGMGRAQRSSVQFSCSVVSPWTAARQPSLSITNCKERSTQSILKEISPEWSLEGLMLKLKLQYFGHLMRRADSFEKTLTLGKIQGRGEGGDRG